MGNTPNAWILHWRYQHVGIQNTIICVTPSANPQREQVEYRSCWIPNSKFSHWPCRFHIVCAHFICLGYPMQTQFAVEYGLKTPWDYKDMLSTFHEYIYLQELFFSFSFSPGLVLSRGPPNVHFCSCTWGFKPTCTNALTMLNTAPQKVDMYDCSTNVHNKSYFRTHRTSQQSEYK